MRSWSSRRDTWVVDEPFYAAWLQLCGEQMERDGKAHELWRDIVGWHQTDTSIIRNWLTGRIPDGREVFYQKHITRHWDVMQGPWMRGVTNCFLIRDPQEVITSLVVKLPEAELVDTGFEQLGQVYQAVRSFGGDVPPIVDAKDLLQNPPGVLTALCERLNLAFDPAMLRWKTGIHGTDGVWASHWYKEVVNTTGFGEYRPKADQVPARLQAAYVRCLEIYHELFQHRITAKG